MEENTISIDIGNGRCKAAILLDASKDPISLIPSSMPMGMRSVAYVKADGTILVNPQTIPLDCVEVRDVKTHLDKETLELRDGNTTFSVDPAKVYGAVANELIRLANQTLVQMGRSPVYRVVVTYPSDFIDTPKPGIMKRSIEELEVDGHKVEVAAMLPEPVAAAVDTLYYERHIKEQAVTDSDYNVAIVDLGHGTLDVAVVTSTNDKKKPFDVVCQKGDADICGRVFDEKIYAELCRQLGEGYTPSANDYRELRFAHAVDMKHELSSDDIRLTSRYFLRGGDAEYTELSLSRDAFEKMIVTDVRNLLVCVCEMLDAAKQKNVPIHEIILTGGASQVPLIKRLLQETFESTGIKVRSFRPTYAVVNGAARHALALSSEKTATQKPVRQHAEYSYGIYIGSDDTVHMMIDSGTPLTAVSEPLEVQPRTNEMSVRVCRSKHRICTADTVPYRDCDEVRRFRFECEQGTRHQMTITIDEDHRLLVECKHSDGTVARQSTFDRKKQ